MDFVYSKFHYLRKRLSFVCFKTLQKVSNASCMGQNDSISNISAVVMKLKNYCRIFRRGRHFHSLHEKRNLEVRIEGAFLSKTKYPLTLTTSRENSNQLEARFYNELLLTNIILNTLSVGKNNKLLCDYSNRDLILFKFGQSSHVYFFVYR